METSYNKKTGKFLLSLNHYELVAINNSLNEICNGVDIEDAEFETRLGVSREELRSILKVINSLAESDSRKNSQSSTN